MDKSITTNAISYFLRQVIREGDVSTEGDGMVYKAHSIRGVGTSLAYKKNWSCNDVLGAATWKSSSVFVSYYLNDLAYELDDVRSLTPFVAAGQSFNT